MKHKLKILFVVLFVMPLVTIFTVVPLYVERQEVQTKTIQLLNNRIGYELKNAYVRWRWLPLPHLSVRNASITTEPAELVLPHTNLYPDWLTSLQKKRITINRIDFVNPRITIKSFQAGKEEKKTRKLPPLNQILIKNGALNIDSNVLPSVFKKKTIQIARIYSVFNLDKNNIKIDLNCNTTFCKSISANGKFNIYDLTYDLKIGAKKLKLHKTIKSLVEGKIIPVASEANLYGYIKGKGFQDIKAKITGELPCFTVQPTDKKMLLDCGVADFELHKQGSNFFININEFELKNPSLKLEGAIKRIVSSTKKDIDPANPVWQIDLRGADLNVDEIRNAVLKLWGDKKAAKHVCNIIRGGRAKSARYIFNGPATDFKQLTAMTIEVDFLSAPIYVPAIDLLLKEASGPIEIKDAYLVGAGLQAKLDGAVGTNGSILLDLAKRDRTFILELDIDADLEKLPPILEKIVKNEPFLDEFAKFQILEGQAKGHLKLGENLSMVKVDLKIKEVQGSIYYDRMDKFIEVNNGQLDLSPQKLSWHKLNGKLGDHELYDSKGILTWKDTIWLIINRFEANINSASLYEELTSIKPLQNKIKQATSAIHGFIHVKKGSFEGPALTPSQWRYRANINAKNLSWRSPLLPGIIYSEKISANLTHENLKINRLHCKILDSNLTFRGELRHKYFTGWHGHFYTSGTTRRHLGQWTKGKEWFPKGLFPKIPFTYSDLMVMWQDNQIDLQGNIFAGEGAADSPHVTLDIKKTPGKTQINEILITGREHTASVSYDPLDPEPETFLFAWKGEVTPETVASLLENEQTLLGDIKGNCRYIISQEKDKNMLDGDLHVSGLQLPFLIINNEPIEIQSLDLSGTGKWLEVENLDVRFGEESSLLSYGSINLDEHDVLFDLYLTSPYFSHDIIKMIDAGMTKGEPVTSPETEKISTPRFGGKIKFNFFRYNLPYSKAEKENDTKHTYSFNPFQGTIKFYPDKGFLLNIDTAQTCCFNLAGTYYSREERGESTFTVTPHCEPLPLFQGTLPCLGIEQDLIEGPFRLDADLQGKPGNWKKGKVSVQSEEGRILRMELLAKIFKVVNLTDLFQDADKPDGNSKRGFAYKRMDIQADINRNNLVITKAVIFGEGLNILARGEMNLKTLDCDFVVLIAPLKTLDAIISKLPIIGRVIAGKDKTVVAIPVGVKGNIRDPKVRLLPSNAIEDAVKNMIKGTLKLPFTILSPILPKEKEAD